MLRFILRRLLEMIPVLFIVATVTFFMMRMAPGGPFDQEKQPTKEIRARLEAHYGLDQPLYKQYLRQMGHLLHGDLGPSFKYPSRTVNEIIADSFPVSLELGLESLVVALVFGLTAGMIASLKQNSALDHIPMSLSMIGLCVPTFVMGPLLISAFALHLDWFNAAGWYFPRDRVLPALTLGAYYAAYIARLTRGGLLEILSLDFIRTARAKGASEARIIWRHALRGALVPIATILALSFGTLVSGALVTETMFAYPGMGKLIYDAVQGNDFNLALAGLLLATLMTLLANLAADVAYAVADPRIAYT